MGYRSGGGGVVSAQGVTIHENPLNITLGGDSENEYVDFTPPGTTDQSGTWSVADPTIATIVSGTGLTTPVNAGTTTVTFVSNDGGFTATGTVNVISGSGGGSAGSCVQINPNCTCTGALNCSTVVGYNQSLCTSYGCTWTPNGKRNNMHMPLGTCSGTATEDCSIYNNSTPSDCQGSGCTWDCGTCASYNYPSACKADATCEWSGSANSSGGSCSQDSDCQTGLSCISNTCALAPFSSDSFNYHASQLLQSGLASISAAIKNIEQDILKMLSR